MPRIRIGDRQEIETLISEEALLLAMFLRQERQPWKPRIARAFVRDSENRKKEKGPTGLLVRSGIYT
jgi:hypothetical protein